MSCEECDKETTKAINPLVGVAYYRWKNANIAIIGCKQHIKEVIEFLNEKRKDV